MDNSVILENLKTKYPNLRNFSYKDNHLLLNGNETYIMSFKNVSLSNINEFLFNLYPNQIFQILYIYELINKNELNEKENNYISSFMNEYYKLKNNNLEGNKVNELYLFCIELLINDSYLLCEQNKPGSILISNIINNKNNEINSGKDKVTTLVLKKDSNPNFLIPEEFNNTKEFEKAGFTTIVLITTAVISTLLYIAFFMTNH